MVATYRFCRWNPYICNRRLYPISLSSVRREDVASTATTFYLLIRDFNNACRRKPVLKDGQTRENPGTVCSSAIGAVLKQLLMASSDLKFYTSGLFGLLALTVILIWSDFASALTIVTISMVKRGWTCLLVDAVPLCFRYNPDSELARTFEQAELVLLRILPS